MLVAGSMLVVVAAALFAPASLIDSRLAAASRGQLRMVSAAGTVWNGSGLVTGESRTWTLPVTWTVDRRSLLRGNVVLTTGDAEGSDAPRGTLAWRSDALTLDQMALRLPAAALDGVLAPGNVVALGGQVAVDASHFTWSGSAGSGTASMRWTGARIAVNAGTLALGTVTVSLTPRDGGLAGRIENVGGDVRIDGDLTLGPTMSAVNMTLAPLPSTPPAVARALGAIGTPDGTGAVRLQWRGGMH